MLRQEGKDHLTGKQRHLTAKSVYYHLFQILKSQYIFHVIRNCLASLSGENKFKGITVHPAQNNTKIDCSVYEKVFMMFTEEKQLSSCTTQGFSVINVNGSDPPTQCTVTTIEIYKSMSKECLISVLLNKQRQVEQTKRPSALPPPHHGRIRIYGTLPWPPPGITAIFDVAGSPGARVWPQTTDGDERAATPVHAHTHFQHLPPGL